MKFRIQKQHGFTIVELLIVIVVIAILASISIVAYNGIQARAENMKTVQAVSTWVKAIKLNKIKNGSYADFNSCLGNTSTYQGFNGHCWAPSTSGWDVDAGFVAAISPEMSGSTPEPSTKNIHTDSVQYRGAMYYHVNDSDVRIYANIVGISVRSECPSIGGLQSAFSVSARESGASCIYRFE